ncbi:MAG: hypothetical protein KatS3mg042_1232 [Rhodothermaceae bacterium]|nr:MAG: hypothetical protein KatS3mg042_1232 [Rhodothermaceae bacterium]
MFKLLLNALLLVILGYLVVRYVRNLVRAALHDGQPPREMPPPDPPAYGPQAYQRQHRTPAPPPRPPHVDIEDARWEDLP